MNIRYTVDLSEVERAELRTLVSGGKAAVREMKRAQILLAADSGRGDEEIAAIRGVGTSTVYRTKRRFVEGNLEYALSEEARPGSARKLSGREEALLIKTACSAPPAGRARWTLELLAGARVKLTMHDPTDRRGARADPSQARRILSECLDRRIGDREVPEAEIAKWARRRNRQEARITWMFTLDKARRMLGRAYPNPAAPQRKAA